jgi:kinesin family protein 5
MDADATVQACVCKPEPGVGLDSEKVAVGKVVKESASPSTSASEPKSKSPSPSRGEAPGSEEQPKSPKSPSPSVAAEAPKLFGPTPQGTPTFLVQGVLACLPWRERGARVLCVSRAFVAACPQDPQSSYWRFLSERLSVEAHLFLPRDVTRIADTCRTWKEIFFTLWALRHAMAPEGLFREVEEQRSVRLQAMARFRPASGREADFGAVSMALPLHQRLQLVKADNPELSASDALKKVVAEHIEHEQTFSAQVVNVTPGKSGSALTASPGCGLRDFSFDYVFPTTASQGDVFDNCGLSVAWDFLNGTNGAVIVYGQTGSGKTHTMFGPSAPVAPEDAGLSARLAEFICEAVDAKGRRGLETSLGMSYVEVFGNETTDLLSDKPIGANRGANQRVGHRYVLEGKVEHPVTSSAEFDTLLASGEDRKRKAATRMNERSTRAHTLLIFRLIQKAPHMAAPCESVLVLADLGGSEKLTKSKANEEMKGPGAIDAGEEEEVARVTWGEYYKARERLTETSHINQGLLVLKRCISALRSSSGTNKSDRKTAVRVPFYDSKLTQLLEPALGGASHTSVIICASREPEHAEETVQSLRFGESCSLVERTLDTGGVSVAVKAAVAQIDKEIKEVEAEIKKKERWDTKTTVKKTIVRGMDTGGTTLNEDENMELGGKGAVVFAEDKGDDTKHEVEATVTGQVLVGAEAENAKLAELLAKKRRLLDKA